VISGEDELIPITSMSRAYSYMVMVGSGIYLTLSALFVFSLEERWDIYLHNVGPIIHGSYALSIFFDIRNERSGFKKIFIYGHIMLQITIPEVSSVWNSRNEHILTF